MIRLFVVTGTRLYAEALTQLLEGISAVAVVGFAACSEEALELIARTEPDVVLLDTMAAPDSASIIMGLLLAVAPELKVIAFAIPDAPEQIVAWAEAGACGYVTSDTSLHDLLPVIESAARGELLCSTSVASALLRRLQQLATGAPRPADVFDLTARQHEVIEHMAQGLSNKEIARAMGISLPTVKNHMHNIFEKLQVHRRADALSRLDLHYVRETSST